MKRVILIYLIAINVITFAAYGIDKHKAERHRWRIPESMLIVLAVLGGSTGALAGMLVFHHKTKKPKFVISVPLVMLAQVTAASLVLINMHS